LALSCVEKVGEGGDIDWENGGILGWKKGKGKKKKITFHCGFKGRAGVRGGEEKVETGHLSNTPV